MCLAAVLQILDSFQQFDSFRGTAILWRANRSIDRDRCVRLWCQNREEVHVINGTNGWPAWGRGEGRLRGPWPQGMQAVESGSPDFVLFFVETSGKLVESAFGNWRIRSLFIPLYICTADSVWLRALI